MKNGAIILLMLFWGMVGTGITMHVTGQIRKDAAAHLKIEEKVSIEHTRVVKAQQDAIKQLREDDERRARNRFYGVKEPVDVRVVK